MYNQFLFYKSALGNFDRFARNDAHSGGTIEVATLEAIKKIKRW